MNKPKIGTKVLITHANQRKYNNMKGEIVSFERVQVFGTEVDAPVIKLTNGVYLRGYECWWRVRK